MAYIFDTKTGKRKFLKTASFAFAGASVLLATGCATFGSME